MYDRLRMCVSLTSMNTICNSVHHHFVSVSTLIGKHYKCERQKSLEIYMWYFPIKNVSAIAEWEIK